MYFYFKKNPRNIDIFLSSKEQMEKSIKPHTTGDVCSRPVALEMQYYIKDADCFKHIVYCTYHWAKTKGLFCIV